MTVAQATRLLDPLFATEAMRAVFSDRGRVQGMLEFEAALARAQARLGMIPGACAESIAAECGTEAFDFEALAKETALAGNPAIPLVRALTARVAARSEEAARYVHWGATSQDAMDTGLVLQLRQAIELIEHDLDALSSTLAALAEKHQRTPLAGRTWLQQAPPVTFGLKAAGWLSAIGRHCVRLRALEPRLLAVQFGGAAGTLVSLGSRGVEVGEALAAELKLAMPALPWHAQRDNVAEFAAALGLLGGTLGKIARDVSLLAQNEVGEAREPDAPGRGGSSTLPHKRNPVGCAVALAAATRLPGLVSTMLAAMVQEHERALGAWHAEWETLPEICLLAAGALAHMRQVLAGLEIDPARMRENLDLTRGLILAEAVTMALGARIGRLPAHRLVEQACRRAVGEGRHLRDVLAEDARVREHLAGAELDRLFDPTAYLGAAEQLVARALASRGEA